MLCYSIIVDLYKVKIICCAVLTLITAHSVVILAQEVIFALYTAEFTMEGRKDHLLVGEDPADKRPIVDIEAIKYRTITGSLTVAIFKRGNNDATELLQIFGRNLDVPGTIFDFRSTVVKPMIFNGIQYQALGLTSRRITGSQLTNPTPAILTSIRNTFTGPTMGVRVWIKRHF